MSTLAPPAPDIAEPEAPSKPRRKRLLLLVLAVVVVAGGLVARSVLLGHPSPTTSPTQAEPGPIVQLETMTLNLADGHFLRLGLALQLTKAAGEDAAPAARAEAGATAVDGAPAQDAAITVLGERTYAQLLAPGGRARAQQQLQKVVDSRYEHKVMRVYFTEFVMQ